MNKKIILWIAAAFLILLTVLSLSLLTRERSIRANLYNLYNNSQDTIKFWKNRDGENVARIFVLSTERLQDFITMRTKDDTIARLQSLVKEYKKQLQNQGSATIIQTITKYDTTYVTNNLLDTIYFPTSTILDSISNRWISSKFGFIRGNTVFSLSVDNLYSVVIGEESGGLFRKKKPFVEITNHNPYTKTGMLRTYQVTQTRHSKWGIGPNVSFSTVPYYKNGVFGFQFTPTIGIGFQYNLINF